MVLKQENAIISIYQIVWGMKHPYCSAYIVMLRVGINVLELSVNLVGFNNNIFI